MKRCRNIGIGMGLALALASVGCIEAGEATLLNPEGNPEIWQVFAEERVPLAGGGTNIFTQLAFGDHPDIADSDDREVTNAIALGDQRFRIVLDELLIGNNLEEILCADGSFARVPIGATPDDIEMCAGAPDFVAANCATPANGGSTDYPVCLLEDGTPIGVADGTNGFTPDGAADDTRMILGQVTMSCDGVDIPVDQQLSYWQPSGNQLMTAGLNGIESLGPALIVVPEAGLRTGANCVFGFADNVTDKDGNQICAPTAGERTIGCTAGEISNVSFGTEALSFSAFPTDGTTNFNLDIGIILQFNANMDAQGVETITIDEVGGEGTLTFCDDAAPTTTCIASATVGMNNSAQVTVTVNNWDNNQEYQVTLPSGAAGVIDAFGGELGEDGVFSFTTQP